MSDSPNQAQAMAQLMQQMKGGSSKQQLLAQMMIQQQQAAAPSVAPSEGGKLRHQLKKLSYQNQQLKQRLSRAGKDRRELLEYLDYLLDLNRNFSSAVGACECWGEDDGCEACQGQGGPGWQPKEEETFALMIAPALDSNQSQEPLPAGN